MEAGASAAVAATDRNNDHVAFERLQPPAGGIGGGGGGSSSLAAWYELAVPLLLLSLTLLALFVCSAAILLWLWRRRWMISKQQRPGKSEASLLTDVPPNTWQQQQLIFNVFYSFV